MALVQCNVCSGDISERAAVCPQCGDPRRPPAWTDRAFKIAVGLASVLFIVMFVLALILAWFAPRGPVDIDRLPGETSAPLALHDGQRPTG